MSVITLTLTASEQGFVHSVIMSGPGLIGAHISILLVLNIIYLQLLCLSSSC